MAETKTYEVTIRKVRERKFLVTTDRGEDWAMQEILFPTFHEPDDCGCPKEISDIDTHEIICREH